jgi:hypothetical protein
MSQAGYTPIQLYFSTTAAAVPVNTNLANGELAINITDGKLYYKNAGGTVTLLASTAGAAGDVVGPASSTDNALARFDLATGKLIQNSVGILSDAGILTGLTGLTSSGSITLSSLTSGRVPYASTGGLLTDSANLTFNGTTLTVNDITDSSLTVGRVVFAGTAGNLTGSAGLFWDNSNERLGIGTGSPVGKLMVYGSSNIIQTNAGSSAALTSYPLLAKNAVMTLVGDSANNENFPGSLGILTTGVGTSTRGANLYLNSTRSTNAQLNSSTFTALNANDALGSIFYGGDNSVNIRTVGAGISAFAGTTWSATNAETYLSFITCPQNSTNAAERVRIDSNGYVGINTTIQNGTRLNVMGGNIVPATSGTTQTGGLRVSSLATGNGGYVLDMGVSDTSGYAWMQVSNSANLSSGFTKPLVLQPVGGNIGIGTIAPNFLVNISTGSTSSITQPTAGSYGLYVQQNTSGSTGGIYIQDGASNSGYSLFVADNNNAARFVVGPDGSVGVGTSGPISLLQVLGTTTSGYASSNSITSGGSAISNSGALWSGSSLRLSANFGGAVNFTGRASELVFGAENANFGGGGGFGSGNLGAITAISENGNAVALASSMLFYTSAGNNINERLRINSTGAFGLNGANYGTSGQVLTSGGSGAAPTWTTVGGGGGGSVAGSNTQVQYNNSGAFGASSNFTFTSGGNLTIGTGSDIVGVSSLTAKLVSTAPSASANNIAWAAKFQQSGYTDLSITALGFSVEASYTRAAFGYVRGTAGYDTGSFAWYLASNATVGNTVTSGDERMRITSGGVLGINNNNPSATAQYLNVQGNGFGGGNGSGIGGSALPQVLITGVGLDNSGSVNPVGIQLVGGGGGVPRGFIMGSYGNSRTTSNDALFFTSNTGSSPFNNGLSAPCAGVYRGPLNATTYAPSNTFPFYLGNGGMTSFGVYDSWTSDYDGTAKAGIQVRLAGGYGGGSPGNWSGFCYTAAINTNFGSGSSGTNFGYLADIQSAGSGNNWAFYAVNGGAAKPGGGSWTATSDSRVKTVLGQYTRGLAEVLQLNVVDYEYNGKGGHAADGKRLTGVVAQEIQEVFPEMVSRRLDKLEETDTENTEILMVDNSALVYALVNCVKELKAELDSAKQRLAALEGA